MRGAVVDDDGFHGAWLGLHWQVHALCLNTEIEREMGRCDILVPHSRPSLGELVGVLIYS